MDLRLLQEVLFPQPLWGACLPQAEQITGEHAGKLQEIRVVCHLDFSDRSPWSVSIFKVVVFVHEINAAVCESVCLHDTVNSNFRGKTECPQNRGSAARQHDPIIYAFPFVPWLDFSGEIKTAKGTT